MAKEDIIDPWIHAQHVALCQFTGLELALDFL